MIGDGGNVTVYERPDRSQYALDKRGGGTELEPRTPDLRPRSLRRPRALDGPLAGLALTARDAGRPRRGSGRAGPAAAAAASGRLLNDKRPA